MNLANKKITLISSDDSSQLSEFLNKKKDFYDEFITLNSDFNIIEIINSANQNDLFESKKYFIIKDVKWFETLEEFNKYSNDLNKLILENINLCIFVNKSLLSKSKKIVEFIQNYFEVIEFEGYNEKNALKYINDYLSKKQLFFSNEIIENLILKTNYDINLLKNEINKIKYVSQENITDKEIVDFISDYSNQQIFNLLKYLYANNTKEFVKLFNHLVDNNINEITIINMVITMMSTHYLIKKMHELHKSFSEIAKIINKSDYVVKLNLKQIDHFSSQFLINQIKMLIEFDFLVKNGDIDKKHAFFKWFFNFHKQQGV